MNKAKNQGVQNYVELNQSFTNISFHFEAGSRLTSTGCRFFYYPPDYSFFFIDI
jgi:hypothetical protein